MSKKLKKNLYEGMYIISATLSDEARSKALGKITDGISTRGGDVLKVHDQGRKRLAYEIDGHKEGHYYIVYFDLPTTEVKELWSEYHLNEDLVRFLTLRADEVKETIEFKSLQVVEE